MNIRPEETNVTYSPRDPHKQTSTPNSLQTLVCLDLPVVVGTFDVLVGSFLLSASCHLMSP